MENINKFISSIDNSTFNKIRQSKSDAVAPSLIGRPSYESSGTNAGRTYLIE